jgi:hypothetical protein
VANLISEILDEGTVKAHENHQVELKFVLEVLRDLLGGFHVLLQYLHQVFQR